MRRVQRVVRRRNSCSDACNLYEMSCFPMPTGGRLARDLDECAPSEGSTLAAVKTV
jgi:hypothetical protein